MSPARFEARRRYVATCGDGSRKDPFIHVHQGALGEIAELDRSAGIAVWAVAFTQLGRWSARPRLTHSRDVPRAGPLL
jgi:hypothetical protein